MTKKLSLFFVFYILVVQPLFAWLLWNNCSFYILAWFNAWVFLVALAISCLWNNKEQVEKTSSHKVLEKKEEKKSDEISEKENFEKEQAVENDKNEIKIQKESVSIPKIVQPISGHNIQKNKKKVYKKTWQRRVLLATLVLAGILARPLWELFWSRSIVISLIVWWIFYLIIGKIADLNGFEKTRTLITNWLYWILIIGWLAYGVNNLYSNGQSIEDLIPSDLWSRIEKYVKNWFLIEDDKESGDTDESNVYIFEWTGEVIPVDSQNINWMDDMVSNNITDVKEDDEMKNNESFVVEVDKNQKLTMWEAIKLLLSTSELSTSKKTVFSYVPVSSDLYPYFETAYEKKMIGKNTEPDKLITCDTYITIKWILEWRYVWSYSDIKSAYWNKAEELWKLNWCMKWEILIRWNL